MFFISFSSKKMFSFYILFQNILLPREDSISLAFAPYTNFLSFIPLNPPLTDASIRRRRGANPNSPRPAMPGTQLRGRTLQRRLQLSDQATLPIRRDRRIHVAALADGIVRPSPQRILCCLANLLARRPRPHAGSGISFPRD